MCPHAQLHPGISPVDNPIRCLLVHDHVLIRQGLRRLLEDEQDFAVIAEASNAAEALQRACEHDPNIILVDLNTFGLPAPEVEQKLRSEAPLSKVVFLSAYEPEDPVVQTIGGDCVLRQTSADELLRMIRGKAYDGHLNNLREIPRPNGEESSDGSGVGRKRTLTAREREVLKLLAEGKTVRSAASVLGVSIKTVDAHKFNLMRKLGIHNKAELVMWAIQKKVVTIPANL